MAEGSAQDIARTNYYQDYWENPQSEDCAYIRWKAAITGQHPSVKSATSILDVGCGSGYMLDALRRPGVRLCGVEMAEGAIAHVRKRGFEGAVVDLETESLPFEAEEFDVVLCYDVLEHLFAPGVLLRQLRRVLKPGGVAMLCVPNTLNAFNRLMFLSGKYVDIMDTSHQSSELFSNHIRLFSKNLFERFVHSGGFRVLEKNFYFPDRFTDPRYRLPANLTKLVTAPRLHEIFPSLFALGLLYVCAKDEA